MKMNFKYVTMLACAALMAGFTSCSKDDDATDVASGEKTFATFNLKFEGDQTRALAATDGATASESKINAVTLYIFNSGQTLEQTIDFTGSTSAKSEITTGQHYFLAAVNFGAKLPTVALNESMTSVKAKLLAIGDITEATTTDAFLMTSLSETSQSMQVAINNAVTIEVGRAVAKVNLSCDGGSATDALSGDNGSLTGITYIVANNPNKMNFYPVYEGATYTSAYHNEVYSVANYFPTVDKAATGISFTKAPYNGTDEEASASYLMENTNAVPLKGNASYLLIKGTYAPLVVVDGNNATATPNGDGTFYRLYNVNTDQYYPFYITVDNPTFSDTSFKSVKEDKDRGHVVNVIKYDKGICYYAFYLRNGSDPVVKRNDYFNVKLDNVFNAGSSLPNINGEGDKETDPDGYTPGTGGGEGDGNDKTPDDKDQINEKTHITGTITVAKWAVVEQSGGI